MSLLPAGGATLSRYSGSLGQGWVSVAGAWLWDRRRCEAAVVASRTSSSLGSFSYLVFVSWALLALSAVSPGS